jgi:hypothetical protein
LFSFVLFFGFGLSLTHSLDELPVVFERRPNVIIVANDLEVAFIFILFDILDVRDVDDVAAFENKEFRVHVYCLLACCVFIISVVDAEIRLDFVQLSGRHSPMLFRIRPVYDRKAYRFRLVVPDDIPLTADLHYSHLFSPYVFIISNEFLGFRLIFHEDVGVNASRLSQTVLAPDRSDMDFFQKAVVLLGFTHVQQIPVVFIADPMTVLEPTGSGFTASVEFAFVSEFHKSGFVLYLVNDRRILTIYQ